MLIETIKCWIGGKCISSVDQFNSQAARFAEDEILQKGQRKSGI
jgi:hypothetical protein